MFSLSIIFIQSSALLCVSLLITTLVCVYFICLMMMAKGGGREKSKNERWRLRKGIIALMRLVGFANVLGYQVTGSLFV